MKFREGSRMRRAKLVFGGVVIVVVIVLTVAAVVVHKSYQANLKPLSTNKASHVVTVQSGATTAEIADNLKSKGAIRSDWAFEWYVRNHQLRDQLKAGTYVVYESQSVEEIVKILISGKVATDLVTILPAQRLAQIQKTLVKAGYSDADVAAALEPTQWASHPALTDKPKSASLEGYLYPESFQKTADTSAKDIIKLSLDEMELRLTPEVRQAFSTHGLTLHQGIILASIVEQEVGSGPDRPPVAQVFLKRYKIGMQLGSDVTAFYGAVINGQEPNVGYDTPYNTRLHSGLPPGPISNVSESSIKAVAFPAQTDWLYFVAGDDGKTYFSKTLEEHEALTKAHCIKLCQ